MVGERLEEYFRALSLPIQLLEEVLSSKFTIIRTKDEKPAHVIPPQEVPVEE